jgi:hypothetical protein
MCSCSTSRAPNWRRCARPGPYLAKASFVEAEVSVEQLYDDAPLAGEIDGFLTAAGFRRITPLPEAGDGDVIYQRVDVRTRRQRPVGLRDWAHAIAGRVLFWR